MQIESACLRPIDQIIHSLDQQSWEKQHVCLVPDNVDDCLAMLQQHAACKSACPGQTSALVVVPTEARDRCSPLLINMCCLGQHKLRGNKHKQWLYRDDPSQTHGVHVADQLPDAIKVLRVGGSDNVPDLTFVFGAKVAGLKCTCLWDSGAARSFISKSFVERHALAVSPNTHPIVLADGSQKQTMGSCNVKLQLHKHHSDEHLHVIDLVDGFDVILGNDWSQQHQVEAKFQGNESRDSHLYLRRTQTRIYPQRQPLFAKSTEAGPALMPEVLSAVQATRLLSRDLPKGCTAPFLVLVRKQGTTEEKQARCLDPGERSKVLDTLLREYAEVFEEPRFGDSTNKVHECIELEPEARPPNRPAFRLPMCQRQEVEKRVEELLQSGGIQPSSSEYGAPVLFVPKPDGTLRMCIDYRALNKVTKKNKYPMPRIDDLMDNLAGAKYFSSLDLTSGYNQFKLVDSDIPKTAFNTHIGKYEWKVLPMGLTNAPAVFQTKMNTLFGKHVNRWVCIYLDDVLIFSKTEEEHFQHIRWVLDILQKNGLKAKNSKCEFFKTELKFLGHIVSENGMKPDPAKVAVIEEWPTPKTVYDVRSFLGLANYFRKFIRGYAAITAPLTDLLKGINKQDKKGRLVHLGKLPAAEAEALKQQFLSQWTTTCQRAFTDLKTALTTAPVLTMPDFEQHFEVVTDACDIPPAIGGVLLQEGHPVAFYSRKLNGAELNYSATDKEMLGVIGALREWRCYLEGKPFTLVTDHKPNTYLDTASNCHTMRRRARWLDESGGFDYVWRYREGRINVADPISRAPQHFSLMRSPMHGSQGWAFQPCRPGAQFVPTDTMSTVCNSSLHSWSHSGAGPPVPSTVAACGLVAQGDALGQTTTRNSTKRRVRFKEGGSDTPEIRRKRKLWDNAEEEEIFQAQGQPIPVRKEDEQMVYDRIEKGFIDRLKQGYKKDTILSQKHRKENAYKRDQDGLHWTSVEQLVIPDYDGLREECVYAVHAHPYAGHYGINRTLKKAQEIYYWPGMRNTIEKVVRECDSCQRVQYVRQKPQGELHPLQIPDRRWESVSLDLITDLPITKKGHDAVVVFVDRLSKMVHVAACTKTVTAERLAELFEQEVFKHHGIPKDIVSDRDVRFQSDFWKSFNDKLAIKLNMSTAKHPQTDGQTERANGILEDTLRHFVGPYQTNWDEYLAVAEFAMNNAWSQSTQTTPFMLNYGQHPDTPVTLQLRAHNPAVNKFVGKWSAQLTRAKRCIQAAQQRQKTQADRRRSPAPEFAPGDEVLIQTKFFKLHEGIRPKLAPRYLGPFKVLKNVGPANLAYKIELPQGMQRVHPVFPVSSLKRYHRSGNYQPPPPPEIIDDEPEWEVDWIAATRGTGSRRQYKVYWVGYPDQFHWEPLRNLTHCQDKLIEFWEHRGEPCPHKI
jgi:hypothetical protein